MTPIIGDKSLTARVTTTPVLNGNQVLAQDGTFLNVGFTRQGSALELFGPATASNTITSSWDDKTKQFTVAVGLDVPADGTTANANVSTAKAIQTNGVWTGLKSPGTPTTTAITISTSGLVTVTATTHGLTTGDKITMAVDLTGTSASDAGLALAAEATAVPVTVVSAGVFTYQVSEKTGFPTTAVVDASIVDGTEFTLATYGDAPAYLAGRVFAGSYSARAYVNTAAAGSKITAGTAAVATASAALSTVASASVSGISAADNTSNKTVIKAGTLSVPMTLQAFDSAAAGVSAGRPVVVTATSWIDGAAAVGTFKINGLSSPVTLLTDATGKVAFTVTETAGLASAQVRIQAVVEGSVTVGADLDWAAGATGLVDYNTTGAQYAPATTVTVNRAVLSKGSYTLALGVTDQWFAAADAATHRLKVTGAGVVEGFVPVVAGMANVVITDSGITSVGSTFTATITLQKATAEVFADTTTILSVVNTVIAAPSVVLGASGSSLYGANAVVLSAAVAAKALVEIDSRTATTVAPDYKTNAIINGAVRNSSTSVGVEGAVVTISGPSNMLFSNGQVSKRGSLSFLSAATTGNFQVLVYSTTAQTDSVVTVTVNGVSTTTKVTFTGIGVGEGTSLVVTMPAAVKPASTFQVKAKLADAFGNGVTASAGRVKVTYTGAGIVFGTLPTSTDANGDLMFSVLLGSNDTGSVNVTVSYDQNGDGDYVDTKDLVTAGTTAIAASGVVAASADTKVNVGSFKGYVALYAKGYKGQKMTAIVAGKWIKVDSLASDFERVVRYTGAGYSITTKIYIDGVQIGDAFTTLTK
jgi:hypothetical protein